MSDFKAKMHQFNFRWGSALDPAGAAYSAPPDPLAIFKGPTSKGRKGRGREGERKGKGKEGEGKIAPNWGVWIRQWCATHCYAHCLLIIHETLFAHAHILRFCPFFVPNTGRQIHWRSLWMETGKRSFKDQKLFASNHVKAVKACESLFAETNRYSAIHTSQCNTLHYCDNNVYKMGWRIQKNDKQKHEVIAYCYKNNIQCSYGNKDSRRTLLTGRQYWLHSSTWITAELQSTTTGAIGLNLLTFQSASHEARVWHKMHSLEKNTSKFEVL